MPEIIGKTFQKVSNYFNKTLPHSYTYAKLISYAQSLEFNEQNENSDTTNHLPIGCYFEDALDTHALVLI